MRNAQRFRTIIDLTYPIPTYHPSAASPVSPDLRKPWSDAGRYPIFGEQTVLWLRRTATSNGEIESGRVSVWEHSGTHMDAPGHFLNTVESLHRSGIPWQNRHRLHEVDARQLVGRVVMIDVSERIAKELAKNNGRPHPDKAVTDFSDASGNGVTADDIEAVADDINDGVWLVMNLGWGQFFLGEEDWSRSPYVNELNHPGMSRSAIDKLIAVMERKKVKISGVAADNLAIDTGEGVKGEDAKRTNAFYSHVQLLQRDILIVENLANLDKLSQASKNSDCTLVVGVMKVAYGTGAPARVIALCAEKADG